MAILGPLKRLDEVAYLRFASVYRQFESADDFEDEIAMLRQDRSDEQAAYDEAGLASLVEEVVQRPARDLLTSAPPG